MGGDRITLEVSETGATPLMIAYRLNLNRGQEEYRADCGAGPVGRQLEVD